MPRVTIQQLLLAGAHFGHLTRRWNPKMRPFIFMEKNGVHILDLKKTESLLEDAGNRMGKIVAEGGDILFVGTKDQARDIMREEAERCSMHYVSERWLGGMLTNFRTIRNSVRTLEQLEAKASDGTYERITKKEQLQIERQKDKLEKVLGGIRRMKRLPAAVFVVDTLRESIAVREARKLGLPVFAICDSNSDPDVVDYVIPAMTTASSPLLLSPSSWPSLSKRLVCCARTAMVPRASCMIPSVLVMKTVDRLVAAAVVLRVKALRASRVLPSLPPRLSRRQKHSLRPSPSPRQRPSPSPRPSPRQRPKPRPSPLRDRSRHSPSCRRWHSFKEL